MPPQGRSASSSQQLAVVFPDKPAASQTDFWTYAWKIVIVMLAIELTEGTAQHQHHKSIMTQQASLNMPTPTR